MPSQATKSRREGLLTWKEIQPFQRDNEFILTGYRPASSSYTSSMLSILAVHNETANIWSHLLGALWFLVNLLLSHRPDAAASGPRPQDRLILGLYRLCVSACFILSTAYHTVSNHSPAAHKLGNELDHLGIVLVMWGTGISGTHFAFYCHRALRYIYFGILTFTALGCAVFTLRPKFRRPEYRTTRFLMYCFLGASLFAPAAHGLLVFGNDLEEMMGLSSFLGLAFINFSGAAIYAARVPERWCPEVFDLLGQSHNWMHVFVLTGALVRLHGLHGTADYWRIATDRYGLCGALI